MLVVIFKIVGAVFITASVVIACAALRISGLCARDEEERRRRDGAHDSRL